MGEYSTCSSPVVDYLIFVNKVPCTVTDVDDNVQNLKGSLVGEVYVNGIDITKCIRENLPIEDAFTFDNLDNYDEED